MAQIRQAPENFPDGRESYGNTYRRLRRIPFYSGTADAEWAAFGLKRMQRAISNDSSFLDPLIRRDAYRLIHDAWAQRDDLMGIPSFESKSKSLLAEFFKRRADYAGITERRDDAILWWLKALTVAPDVEDYAEPRPLVGTDYDRLVRTRRLFSAIPGSRLVTALSCDGRRFAVSERGPRVWDLERPALPPIALRDRPAEITFDFDFLKFSPNGRLLAATGQDSAVFVWDLQRPEEPLKPIMGSQGGYLCRRHQYRQQAPRRPRRRPPRPGLGPRPVQAKSDGHLSQSGQVRNSGVLSEQSKTGGWRTIRPRGLVSFREREDHYPA